MQKVFLVLVLLAVGATVKGEGLLKRLVDQLTLELEERNELAALERELGLGVLVQTDDNNQKEEEVSVGGCKDEGKWSSKCQYWLSQCETSSRVQRICKKSCGLCK
ncbi:unnamed protein product [Owenia fusiformis]|uniref:Uncharacterized protein n=1 Tax=Owenia fusiformis TaxID=6347 RepID=A0A8J1U5D3_OWEFU|nr:unnamed protein product [Owenia fusiformis]